MRYDKIDLKLVAKEFKSYVGCKKRFRNRNLNSTIIATELGVSRTILSQAVNQELKTSINDYINQKRLNYLDSLKNNNTEGLTQEQMILLSGFSCPSTYYRIIKKLEIEKH